MDKKELVLQIEELEERIAPGVVNGGHGSNRSHGGSGGKGSGGGHSHGGSRGGSHGGSH